MDISEDAPVLSANLDQLEKEGALADVTIRVKGQEFNVHKLFLCGRLITLFILISNLSIRCEYFNTLIHGNFKEAVELQNGKQILDLTIVSVDVFKAVVE